jgi:hypothetical protein
MDVAYGPTTNGDWVGLVRIKINKKIILYAQTHYQLGGV